MKTLEITFTTEEDVEMCLALLTEAEEENKFEREYQAQRQQPVEDKEWVEGQYHYFTSSALHWCAGGDLLKTIARQKKADIDKSRSYNATGFSLYRVPLPDSKDHPYKIHNFVPKVEGVEWLLNYQYPTTNKKGT